jgi:hypothetical protein
MIKSLKNVPKVNIDETETILKRDKNKINKFKKIRIREKDTF